MPPMKHLILLILLCLCLPTEAKPRKSKAQIVAVEPTDMDWIWENGPYMAIWVQELEDGFAWLVGPEFPEGIRIMKDSQDAVTFKNRLVFLVNKLAEN
jgi:hypothetical protein